MVKFFVPAADSPEQAERLYAMFVGQSTYELAHPTARLFSVTFPHGKHVCTAEVGKPISHWPEPDGIVFGIVEKTGLVTVHTERRGMLSATPILVSRAEAAGRQWFEDYPAD